ncbi:efflux RND transporter periplasmic adaptor subunit [Paraburkholderia dilworthii]|uniref:efflux RND transporter periplasmic adaptor subunit n=1 Tax=Paraburkholderia dilworthii TaxID=948106 RepID=UPI000A05C1C5|nr:efflux RND transporter periplasmic adaptor subunit [Paraburkholderia dilworthii]
MQELNEVSQHISTPVRHPRRGRRAAVLLILALIAAAIGYHVVRKGAPAVHRPAQVVTVAPVTLGDMPETLNELGTVTPVATVTVLPQLSGYLTAVAYKEGQDIGKGLLLVQIDPRQYEIDKQQAEAQLAKDQASLAQARSDLARYAELNAKKSIAQQTYVDQQFTVRQDEAAVKADQASIAQYNLDLAFCRITSPISGRVGLRLVDPGNYVTASSSTGVAIVTQMKPTTVEFTVPQDMLGQVLARMQSGAKLPVTVYGSNDNKQIATGTLYAASNQVATSTGTVTLRAMFANDDEELYPNEFVDVRLLVDVLHNAVLVPTAAVQTGAPGTYVYVANADGTVSVHKVTSGPTDGKYTAILAGLTEGQRVVTDGMDRLSDGARIRVAGTGAGKGNLRTSR